jgi:hypothetical protein
MVPASLYRRVLGARFDALPEVLRRFHDEPAGGRAHGTLRVDRASGWLRNGLALLSGMPAAATAVPVRLQIAVEGDRERWIRHFDQSRVQTVQWAWRGLLMESFGPVAFACALVVEGSRLHYEFRRAWFSVFPLPRWLAPHVVSFVDAGEGGWRLTVRIFAPILGELVRYEGWIEPEPE